MRCAWEAYLAILPLWMRQEVDRRGKNTLQEIRLRKGRPPELITAAGSAWLGRSLERDDLSFVVNMASRYSPWSATTAAMGYITAPGGHRIGLCGDAIVAEGSCQGIREPTSLCLRVARDFPGIGSTLAKCKDSILIIGSPGSGKTTLLRDIIRQKSDMERCCVAVVDERGEIFPQWQSSFCFPPGLQTDVLTGCKKSQGIEMLLRTMAPEWIALDEITAAEDCDAVIRADHCGVRLIATAHAESIEDLQRRDIYKRLVESGVFSNYVVLRRDKSFIQERMVV